jgi:hypothetical protein
MRLAARLRGGRRGRSKPIFLRRSKIVTSAPSAANAVAIA